ncbi:hypothetical protein [Gloeobacter morelensis]|uniref:Cupin n=1 Tax=Gloeobacter morelensis MG652769 TaxID=2781736 RepID=A0ABY3PQU5_9CYAN|nr:hypothetical protein [Gloeobacter morelensis]UFP96030.1 cupin [Gloeobacter morelensis MG652769]
MAEATDGWIENRNWLVTAAGQCDALPLDTVELPVQPYRLYRFLTEVEDILSITSDAVERVRMLMPLVRKLLCSSYWLQLQYTAPSADPGWSVHCLYDEFDFPLTVQMVAWLPGQASAVHNHATWGIVAVVQGREKNCFWRRSPTIDYPDQVEMTGEKIVEAGDIIAFTPEAIHSIESLGDQPVVTFNLYGETDYTQRFEFNLFLHTAMPF